MKQKLLSVLPFFSAGYCLIALVLVCVPPWVVTSPGTTRYFYGFAPLWGRAFGKMNNGAPDWPSLAVELLAALFAAALLLALYACWLRLHSPSPELEHTPMHKNCPACDAIRDAVDLRTANFTRHTEEIDLKTARKHFGGAKA